MKTKEQDELFDRSSAPGSPYDHAYFTDDQLKQGAEINRKAAAGEVSWDSAHNWWENTRAGYGYSGGEDGHGYTTLANKAKESAPSYIDRYQGGINQAANALLNRKAFAYDPAKEPMYQQYADSYTRQGKQAMEDTLAQVSARTGGLASSYAGTAAQQTYNGYMSALADKVPELRQLAYEMYMDEGDTMRQNLQMLQGLEQTDYNRYLDALGQWNDNRQFDYNAGQDAKNWAYKQRRDEVADGQYEQERADEKAMAAAQLLGQTGDYSKYKELLGLTDDQVAALEKWNEEQNAPKVMGGDNSMTLDTAKAMAKRGQFTDDVLRVLRKAGFNDEYLKLEYGYEPQPQSFLGGVAVEEYDAMGGNYQEVAKYLGEMKTSGASAADILAAIKDAKESGVLNQADYMRLYNQYRG